jgi:hypothetical protein
VPVPKKYAKGVDGLTVPLCPTHADDWTVVRFRSTVGSFLILAGMAMIAAVVWEVQPLVAAPKNQTRESRILATGLIGLFSAFPIGAFMLWWAKTPIRVLDHRGRLATIAGVCGKFAKAAKEAAIPAALPIISEDVRFEVSRYAPARSTPPEVLGKLSAVTILAAGILGGMVGVAGREVGTITAGWQPNDWRYFGFLVAVAAAYLVPQFGLRAVFASRFGALGVAAITGLVAGVALISRAFGFTLSRSFAGVFCLGPLLYFAVAVAGRYVWRWRVRNPVAAMAAGACGPLTLAGIAYLIAGTDPGPHRSMPMLAAIAAVVGGMWNLKVANTPYCFSCDGWLADRRIGAFPRPRAEMELVISEGEVVSLAGVEPYAATASIGDVELHVHSCPACRENGSVVLELFDCTPGGKSKKQPVQVRVGRWLYPGAALVVIEKLFPPPVVLVAKA